MTFDFPLRLTLAALAVWPLLRRRRPSATVVTWSQFEALRTAAAAARSRRGFDRLRRFLQAAAIAGFAIASAGPQLSRTTDDVGSTVVLLDDSLSMTRMVDGLSPWESGKSALAILQRSVPTATLVFATTGAAVPLGSVDVATLRPSDASFDWETVTGVTEGVVDSRDSTTLLVLSDREAADAGDGGTVSESEPNIERLEPPVPTQTIVVDTASRENVREDRRPPRNRSLVEFEVEPSRGRMNDDGRREFVWRVAVEPPECNATVRVRAHEGGRGVEARVVNGLAEGRIELGRDRGVIGELIGADSFAGDDVRYAVAIDESPISVAVVSAESATEAASPFAIALSATGRPFAVSEIDADEFLRSQRIRESFEVVAISGRLQDRADVSDRIATLTDQGVKVVSLDGHRNANGIPIPFGRPKGRFPRHAPDWRNPQTVLDVRNRIASLAALGRMPSTGIAGRPLPTSAGRPTIHGFIAEVARREKWASTTIDAVEFPVHAGFYNVTPNRVTHATSGEAKPNAVVAVNPDFAERAGIRLPDETLRRIFGRDTRFVTSLPHQFRGVAAGVELSTWMRRIAAVSFALSLVLGMRWPRIASGTQHLPPVPT